MQHISADNCGGHDKCNAQPLKNRSTGTTKYLVTASASPLVAPVFSVTFTNAVAAAMRAFNHVGSFAQPDARELKDGCDGSMRQLKPSCAPRSSSRMWCAARLSKVLSSGLRRSRCNCSFVTSMWTTNWWLSSNMTYDHLDHRQMMQSRQVLKIDC